MMKDKRSAYTLFELIAVLTLSGIIFMVVMGSWNSWSAVQACNGAANIIKSKIRQGRALAMAKSRYTGIELVSYTTNRVQHITACQLYLSTNDSGNVESLLNTMSSSASMTSQQSALSKLGLTPAAPRMDLSGQIYVKAGSTYPPQDSGTILFFRPDGSIWNGESTQYHYISIFSRHRFDTIPLIRTIHIDLPTGAVAIIREEDQ